jgi:SAM-dependent methyltransferase
MRLRLPDRSRVEMTGPTDPICLHYRWPFRLLLNRRLTAALGLLNGHRFRRVLDAGVGGGVLLPELAVRCERLYGVDLHERLAVVAALARREAVGVGLCRSSITALPFADGAFDAVVCLSVLEFVAEYETAITELARVTAPGGSVVLGFPVTSWMTDLGYRLARTPDPRQVHQADHRALLAAADRHLRRRRLVTMPSGAPVEMALFVTGIWTRR